MKMVKNLKVILALLGAMKAPAPPPWDYKEPGNTNGCGNGADWGDDYEACDVHNSFGIPQSPIALPNPFTVPCCKKFPAEFDFFSKIYYDVVSGENDVTYFKDDYQTVVTDIELGPLDPEVSTYHASYYRNTFRTWDADYSLWRYPSEHTMGGKRFDLEL